jgi:hypothetical protein
MFTPERDAPAGRIERRSSDAGNCEKSAGFLLFLRARPVQQAARSESFNHASALVCLPISSGALATEYRETVRLGYRNIKAAHNRITDAGRRALEG